MCSAETEVFWLDSQRFFFLNYQFEHCTPPHKMHPGGTAVSKIAYYPRNRGHLIEDDPVFLTSGDLHFESACRGPAGKIVQDFPSGNCRSWPKPTYCFSPEKVTQNMVYAVLPCTMFSAFNSLVIFCRKKICRFYKKFLTFSLPCGIHKSGDGRHPSV